jgi:hypothetical protein
MLIDSRSRRQCGYTATSLNEVPLGFSNENAISSEGENIIPASDAVENRSDDALRKLHAFYFLDSGLFQRSGG